jgi:hypothetical protein
MTAAVAARLTRIAARFGAQLDATLRADGAFGPHARTVPTGTLAAVIGGCGCVFGAVMGGYAGRPLQMLFSGLKVPLLLAAATAIVLPGFYALNSALGLRDDFVAALRGVLAAQATLAVALAACAPLELLVHASGASYPGAVDASGVCFFLATLAGQVTLGRHYALLVARDARHRTMRRIWALLYVFVAIQVAWVLRPFVGAPTLEPGFLRRNAWSNAYVVVIRDALALFRR